MVSVVSNFLDEQRSPNSSRPQRPVQQTIPRIRPQRFQIRRGAAFSRLGFRFNKIELFEEFVFRIVCRGEWRCRDRRTLPGRAQQRNGWYHNEW